MRDSRKERQKGPCWVKWSEVASDFETETGSVTKIEFETESGKVVE